jgi:hypothetical protein
MTEVPKGLITSKELGMAVADRLIQAEKRRDVRGAETPKQQTPMRRVLQPPATREQRGDERVRPAKSTNAEVQPAPAPDKSLDGRTEQEIAEEQWAEKFLEEMTFNPDAEGTDADWERLERLDPITYGRAKYSFDLKDSIRGLKEESERVRHIPEDKLMELAHYGAGLEREKTEAWAKVGIRRLPHEAWVKQMRHDEKKWNEKTDEEKQRIYKERIQQRGDGAYPYYQGETERRLYKEARDELYSDPSWQRKDADEFRAKVHGLPPMTDEEWREYQRIETMSLAELVQKFGTPLPIPGD